MQRRTLRALMRKLGANELARQWAVSPSTVRRWARDGVPSRRREQLEAWREPAPDEEAFSELDDLLYELGPREKVRRHTRKRDMPTTIGKTAVLPLEQNLTPALAAEVIAWARTVRLPERLPVWIGTVFASMATTWETTPTGSRGKVIDPGGERKVVVTDRVLSSGKQSSRAAMVRALAAELFQAASDPVSPARAHYGVIETYRYKTDEERRAHQTAARKEREKGLKRRAKPAAPKKGKQHAKRKSKAAGKRVVAAHWPTQKKKVRRSRPGKQRR